MCGQVCEEEPHNPFYFEKQPKAKVQPTNAKPCCFLKNTQRVRYNQPMQNLVAYL
ncbi:hypothetical protein HanPSC8_Chr15g0689881 [Helianthus annuus]|nr:hypothetical protein HanPSC8_Chr15g0689881 [Helianthus annuus]